MVNMHGVPTEGGSIYGSVKRPARPDYEIDRETGCWNWLKFKTPHGYPSGHAHRRYYALANGLTLDDLKGKHVHHRCHNPSCVNPAHLEPTAPSTHIRAHKIASLRTLSATKRAELREMGRDPTIPYRVLAERFGVGETYVIYLLRNERFDEGDAPIVLHPRECLFCKGEVIGRRRNARFCCVDCRLKYNRRKPEQRAKANERQRRYWAEQKPYRQRKAAGL